MSIATAHKQHYKSNVLDYFAILLVFIFYGICLAHKFDITAADIGRHIKNGEYFVHAGQIIKTNFYSYTYPDFLVINHHWGAGVIFYLFWKLSGFTGLHIFFTVVSLGSLAVYFRVASNQSGSVIASLISVAIIPLLAHRMEIRPEVFSYLFSGLYVWILSQHRSGKLSDKKVLFLLPLIEFLWVNTHIYFILGPAVVGCFLLESAYLKRNNLKMLSALLACTCIATLINPFGIEGALAPFNIFSNYGFDVMENMPVWYNDRYLPATYSVLFKLSFILLVASYGVALIKNHRCISIAYLLLSLFISCASWLAVRNFALFGFITLPIISHNMSVSFGKLPIGVEQKLRTVTIAVLLLGIFIVATGRAYRFVPMGTEIGFGLVEKNLEPAEFIKQQHITGPIFNSYNVGSYLVFNLFPDLRVFVDNRPEAYPASFFQHTYIPALHNEAYWKMLNHQHRFSAIILASGEQGLLDFKMRRLRDPEWENVFIDMNVSIFLRRH